MEAAAAVLALDLVLAVQHLVEDDPGHEVVGHAVLVQRRVDADDAVLDREAPHLDRPAAPAARRHRPPGDARLQPAAEVRRVQPIEDRLQVVVAPVRAQVDLPRPPLLLADDVLVPLDVVAQQRRRAPIVVHDVAGQRAHGARLGADEHPVQAQPVAVGLPAHRDHAVVVVGQPQLQRLAGRQVERERGRDPIGLLLERGASRTWRAAAAAPQGRGATGCRRRTAGDRRRPTAGAGMGRKAGRRGFRKTASRAPDAPRRHGESDASMEPLYEHAPSVRAAKA